MILYLRHERDRAIIARFPIDDIAILTSNVYRSTLNDNEKVARIENKKLEEISTEKSRPLNYGSIFVLTLVTTADATIAQKALFRKWKI